MFTLRAMRYSRFRAVEPFSVISSRPSSSRFNQQGVVNIWRVCPFSTGSNPKEDRSQLENRVKTAGRSLELYVANRLSPKDVERALRNSLSNAEKALDYYDTAIRLENEKAAVQKTLDEKPKDKFAMITKYGIPFVLWWGTVYFASGAAIYGGISLGLFGGADIIDFLHAVGAQNYFDLSAINPAYGNLILTVVVNEFLEPIRFPFCVATTPMIMKAFSKIRGNKGTEA